MRTNIKCGRLLWRLAALVIVLLMAIPAQAKPKKPKKEKKPKSTESIAATSSTSDLASSTGDINPTSVPIVEDDFEGIEMSVVAEDPMKAGELSLSDCRDNALLDQVNATTAHRTATGQGVVVAVLDAGFALDHPAFAGRVASAGWDFVDGDADPSDHGDGVDNDGDGIVDRAVGHGSLVAAMVLNAAPDATILPIRIRDDEGLGSNWHVVLALDYAMACGVDVINLSIDVMRCEDDVVRWAVEAARAQGICVVAAAGNDGLKRLPNQIVLAANLIVGAVDDEDVLAPFTNYGYRGGEGRMIFAPGVDLVGPMVGEGVYTRGSWSGTSFAAGIVSGAVALLKELHPDWSPGALAYAVSAAVSPVFAADGKQVKKCGRVDLGLVVQR